MTDASSVPICPHCGHDIRDEQDLTKGRFRLVPGIGIYFAGRRLALSPQCREIFAAVMRLNGAVLTYDALLLRLDSEAEDVSNFVSVQLFRIKCVLASAGAPYPIERVRSLGLRWQASGCQREGA